MHLRMTTAIELRLKRYYKKKFHCARYLSLTKQTECLMPTTYNRCLMPTPHNMYSRTHSMFSGTSFSIKSCIILGS